MQSFTVLIIRHKSLKNVDRDPIFLARTSKEPNKVFGLGVDLKQSFTVLGNPSLRHSILNNQALPNNFPQKFSKTSFITRFF